jgi:hemoglobin
MDASAEALRDVETRDDCERLVRAFYGRALEDPIIGWLFTDVARLDLEAHVPQITSFWETILLGTRSYDGSPFPPHAEVHAKAELRAGHFGRWLALWTTTVDELFAGERADLAKAHALRVAQAFHRRLQSFPSPGNPDPTGDGGDAPPPPGGLVVTLHGADPSACGGMTGPDEPGSGS